MKLEQDCALLVIDIQQEDFIEMNKSNWDDPDGIAFATGSGSWTSSVSWGCR